MRLFRSLSSLPPPFLPSQSSGLRLLQSLNEETAAEFCRMSIDGTPGVEPHLGPYPLPSQLARSIGLSKPVTRKALSAAAASLSCTPEEIKAAPLNRRPLRVPSHFSLLILLLLQLCLDAVSMFLLDAAKLQLRDGDVPPPSPKSPSPLLHQHRRFS